MKRICLDGFLLSFNYLVNFFEKDRNSVNFEAWVA